VWKGTVVNFDRNLDSDVSQDGVVAVLAIVIDPDCVGSTPDCGTSGAGWASVVGGYIGLCINCRSGRGIGAER
jgi:hypothetical protein